MINKSNLKWKVSEAPTGRYRSFHKRAWPEAYIGDQIVFMVTCEDAYTADRARGETPHAPLILHVAILTGEKSGSGVPMWRWKSFVKSFLTLADAKDAASRFYANNKEQMPGG